MPEMKAGDEIVVHHCGGATKATLIHPMEVEAPGWAEWGPEDWYSSFGPISFHAGSGKWIM